MVARHLEVSLSLDELLSENALDGERVSRDVLLRSPARWG